MAKYEYGYFLSGRDMFAPIEEKSKEPDDDYFDIFWIDGAGMRFNDRFAQLKSYQRINHFPGMNIICRKNELGKLLN